MATDLNFVIASDSLRCKRASSQEDINVADKVDCYIIDAGGNEQKCRGIVEKLRGRDVRIGVVAADDVFNRRVLETMKIHFLIDIELGDLHSKRDSLKQRDSGLNHVLAKIAAKKGVVFVLNVLSVRSLGEMMQGYVLSRVMQNVTVCRRAKAQYIVGSFAEDKQDIVSLRDRQVFLQGMGASSEQLTFLC